MTLRSIASTVLFVCGFAITQNATAGQASKPACFCCAQKRCELTVSIDTEETECFEVECKDVCIPPVTFPWECRPKKCGRIRTVNVLTTETREQPVCVYTWDVVVICPRCRDVLQASGCELAPGMRVMGDSARSAKAPDAARGEDQQAAARGR